MHPEALLWCDANALLLLPIYVPSDFRSRSSITFARRSQRWMPSSPRITSRRSSAFSRAARPLHGGPRQRAPQVPAAARPLGERAHKGRVRGLAVSRRPGRLCATGVARPLTRDEYSPDGQLSRVSGCRSLAGAGGEPSILSLSLQANVMPTVEYLRSLGMVEVGRVITKQPRSSVCPSSNFQPKVAFLTSLGLDELGRSRRSTGRVPCPPHSLARVESAADGRALMSAGLIVKRASAGDEPTALRARHRGLLEGRVRLGSLLLI